MQQRSPFAVRVPMQGADLSLLSVLNNSDLVNFLKIFFSVMTWVMCAVMISARKFINKLIRNFLGFSNRNKTYLTLLFQSDQY